MRGDQAPTEQPAGRIYKIEKQNRVRFPSQDFADLLPWLRGQGAVERVALAGSWGGLSLEDPERVRLALSRLEAANLTGRDAAGVTADYARFLALRWPVELRLDEDRRYSINLPEDARKAGLVPSAPGAVAVLVIGEILEIWDVAEWRRRPREPREYALEMILEELEGGG